MASQTKEQEKQSAAHEEKKQELGVFNQPIPPEDINDPFDRQKCIQGWRQDTISKQVCLVLGVGGIGCTVAMALARLGVAKLILVDYDKVEATNLNRQILFDLQSVGKYKIDAAKQNLERYHILSEHTKVETYNMDVVKSWHTVCKLATQSDVIFNLIDYGGGFDIAVLSLCMHLKKPYASGSSYCHSWIVEYFTGKQQHSSFSFDNPDSNITKEILDKLQPDKIATYKDLSTWLPKDDNPPTRLIGSSCLCAVSGGMMTVNAWVQGLIERDEEENHCMPNYTKLDMCHYWDADDLVAWPMPMKEEEEQEDNNKKDDDTNKDKTNQATESSVSK